jgi:EAL domain-containing protein (putative c-di-GMP-specific phosphodiesterase class I)
MTSTRPRRWTQSNKAAKEPQKTAEEDAPQRSVHDLAVEDLDVVFQPIVELASRRIFAYEALTRCKWPEFANPAVLFHTASAEDACGRLGRLVREVAFDRGAGFPLFVNVHPDELQARWLVRPDDPLYLHDHNTFIEITESAAFTHYDLCKNVLREMSMRGGVFLAVDDLGAGYSNLMRVLDLEPHVVKLDRALVTALDKSRRQQILVRHVVALCTELGAKVVAEGIETPEELHAVTDAGVHYVQGYVFARPSYPLPKAKWPGGDSLAPETATKTAFGAVRGR